MSATSEGSTPSPPPATSSSSLLATHASRNSMAPSSSPAPTFHFSRRLSSLFPSSSPPPPSGGISTELVVIVIAVVAALAFLGSWVFYHCKNKKQNNDSSVSPSPPQGPKYDPYGKGVKMPPKPSPPPAVSSHPPEPENSPHSPSLQLALNLPSTFTREELATATDNFSNANLLGQGGFGYVHKGVLSNGREVAVKQLKEGSHQGDREFKTEVEIISQVHHKHLVSLVGYCITGSQRMLVYEFVPNHSLEFHLHCDHAMDWPTRLEIARGVAKVLAYLHEECKVPIIHRDIKAANILLDFNFEAKVSDFGLAKFFPDNYTHISTAVKGTFGYMAPEYASSGRLTAKSDVFSFGVVLLELVTGQKPTNNDIGLATSARRPLLRALKDGNFSAHVDPRLQMCYVHNEMVCMVACAVSCVRRSAKQRPTMSQVLEALKGNFPLSDLNEGIPLANNGSLDDDTNQNNEDIERLGRMDFGTQDSGNAEYSSSSERQHSTPEMEMGRTKNGR
ncbi:Non-specific serine/threonine protein kinase [Bertholletia excelsa]